MRETTIVNDCNRSTNMFEIIVFTKSCDVNYSNLFNYSI